MRSNVILCDLLILSEERRTMAAEALSFVVIMAANAKEGAALRCGVQVWRLHTFSGWAAFGDSGGRDVCEELSEHIIFPWSPATLWSDGNTS